MLVIQVRITVSQKEVEADPNEGMAKEHGEFVIAEALTSGHTPGEAVGAASALIDRMATMYEEKGKNRAPEEDVLEGEIPWEDAHGRGVVKLRVGDRIVTPHSGSLVWTGSTWVPMNSSEELTIRPRGGPETTGIRNPAFCPSATNTPDHPRHSLMCIADR